MPNGDFPDVFTSRPMRYRSHQTVTLTNPIPAILFVLFAGLGFGLFSVVAGTAGIVLAVLSGLLTVGSAAAMIGASQ